jgi:hypothetical protein
MVKNRKLTWSEIYVLICCSGCGRVSSLGLQDSLVGFSRCVRQCPVVLRGSERNIRYLRFSQNCIRARAIELVDGP